MPEFVEFLKTNKFTILFYNAKELYDAKEREI